uniref:Uncharacterized protein n=1 Tax=Noctiluca scintillans TaxID=2966 RepID=A0A7S1A1S8_NOCSC|mmetsp:Transcript_27148/g.71440  ORF Transcript_27148/g.71440 Transcript_27148/m.71440 type:complete len:119 (+) Transcript_27148:227-583(+)
MLCARASTRSESELTWSDQACGIFRRHRQTDRQTLTTPTVGRKRSVRGLYTERSARRSLRRPCLFWGTLTSSATPTLLRKVVAHEITSRGSMRMGVEASTTSAHMHGEALACSVTFSD